MKTNPMKYALALLAAVALVSVAGQSLAEEAADATAIRATAESFHKALAVGEAEKVMSLLLPDALIAEGGAVQTRSEYESGHLAADIAYAGAVPGRQLTAVVRQVGDVAWITSTFKVQGKFKGKPVDSMAAETMVLAKTPEGWRIRNVHWSSHREH